MSGKKSKNARKQNPETEENGEEDENEDNVIFDRSIFGLRIKLTKKDVDPFLKFKVRKGDSVFKLLGKKKNRNVLYMLIFISIFLAFVSFGSFFAVRYLCSIYFPGDKDKRDIYSVTTVLIVSQLTIFLFGVYAYRYDKMVYSKEQGQVKQIKAD